MDDLIFIFCRKLAVFVSCGEGVGGDQVLGVVRVADAEAGADRGVERLDRQVRDRDGEGDELSVGEGETGPDGDSRHVFIFLNHAVVAPLRAGTSEPGVFPRIGDVFE